MAELQGPQEAKQIDPRDDPRRELRPGEVLCGICGYPAKIVIKTGEDGAITETVLPHYGNH